MMMRNYPNTEQLLQDEIKELQNEIEQKRSTIARTKVSVVDSELALTKLVEIVAQHENVLRSLKGET